MLSRFQGVVHWLQSSFQPVDWRATAMTGSQLCKAQLRFFPSHVARNLAVSLGSATIAVLCLVTHAKAATPAPDTASILTIKTENDVIAHTDQNYTAGLRLGWTSPSADPMGGEFLPDLLTDVGSFLWGLAGSGYRSIYQIQSIRPRIRHSRNPILGTARMLA